MKEQEALDAAFEKYLDEDINWGAYKNEVIIAADKSEKGKDDVEQFAYDSFQDGWMAAKEYFEKQK